MFQDAMDPDRLVKPVDDRGTKYLCKVYWRVENGLVYGGKTELPKSLFSDDPRNRYVGFTAAA